jgi:hypothetical protein
VAYQRDPVSKWFDPAAVRLIARAYAARGEWAGVYVGPPTAMQWVQLGYLQVNPWERDRWGEQRWIRALKRSVYWHVCNFGGVSELRDVPNVGAFTGGWHAPVRVQWETGQLVRKAGWPTRRRAVRIRLHAGGSVTSRIGKTTTPKGKRWVDDRGAATARASTPEDRDWEAAG